jgi:hypothetical protein
MKPNQIVLESIVEVLKEPLEWHGLTLVRPSIFENLPNTIGNVFQYEILLSHTKGRNHLHLVLKVCNQSILSGFRETLKKLLLHSEYSYPKNWTEKDIKSSIKKRTGANTVFELTDWRPLREDSESLEEFADRFSIWLCAFEDLAEIRGWREQLELSVELAMRWFCNFGSNEYLMQNSGILSLYLYHLAGDFPGLQARLSTLLQKPSTYFTTPQEISLYQRILAER